MKTMKKSISKALIIFIKNPEKGKVKTRLAKTEGEDFALRTYLALQQKTKEVALKTNAEAFLFYSNEINTTDDWDNLRFKKLLQQGQTLGSKMKTAFEEVLKISDKAVIIGSDCYDISEEIIETAFSKLEEYDVVFGPANDGGYYLLGMSKLHPELFEDIEWSTEKVLKDSIKNLKEKSYFLLQELIDIDTIDDLKQTQLYDILKQQND